jgi:transcriptional regulator with XRE-family HTH domain
MIAERFGGNLASCRRLARLSQEELAERAALHHTGISQMECGERIPGLDTVVRLAGSLGVSFEELLDGLGWEPGETRPGRYTER